MSPYSPPPDGPDILFADDHLIVADKPSGLLSVPGRGEDKADCARSRVQRSYPDALTVHRLDMSTSGLLLFARSKAAQKNLSGQFEHGQVEKIYLADVWQTPEHATGFIDLPLIADWPNRPRQKVDHAVGKPSRTGYQILHSTCRASRVRLMPMTGRSHQLRVHMMALGHPVLGDDLYANGEARDVTDRLHLHAARIRFRHPATGEPIAFDSNCPFETP